MTFTWAEVKTPNVKLRYERCTVKSFDDKTVTLICGKERFSKTMSRSEYEKYLGKPSLKQPSLVLIVTGMDEKVGNPQWAKKSLVVPAVGEDVPSD